MRTLRYFSLLFSFLILSAFTDIDKSAKEYRQLQKFELLALKNESIGKVYIYDLTKKEGCNKTAIKYLGVIKTKSGKRYKVLSSFFVYSAGSTCHGTSSIKIYEMGNKFVGEYYVGSSDELPEKITGNKFVCWSNSKGCELRKDFSINFEKGLPKSFFLPCSKTGGNEYGFSGE